jgi:hypothetical protein
VGNTLLISNALDEHFDRVYLTKDGLDEALRELLPSNLADHRVAALESTGFLTVAGLQRLKANCQKAKSEVERGWRTSPRA